MQYYVFFICVCVGMITVIILILFFYDYYYIVIYIYIYLTLVAHRSGWRKTGVDWWNLGPQCLKARSQTVHQPEEAEGDAVPGLVNIEKSMERSSIFLWDMSLFRLAHGFNSYFDTTRLGKNIHRRLVQWGIPGSNSWRYGTRYHIVGHIWGVYPLKLRPDIW
jgi:hypothetical protein